jgi:hypothetical protein
LIEKELPSFIFSIKNIKTVPYITVGKHIRKIISKNQIMKRFLITIFLFVSTLTQGQISFIGFDTTICSSSMINTYTYSNWTSGSGSGFQGGYQIFKNGIQVYSDYGYEADFKRCEDIIFINDSVGFIAVHTQSAPRLYKTIDYGVSWSYIGGGAPNYFGTYIINESHAYLVTQYANSLYITKCSDIPPSNFFILDDTINTSIYINDTIIGNSLCNIDSLKILINNDLDTIIYHINFTFISVGIPKDNLISNSIKLFPNPTSNQLSIDTDLEISEINIIDITGKNIKTIKPNTNLVNVADLSVGIYFIKVTTDKETITQKFVKQ